MKLPQPLELLRIRYPLPYPSHRPLDQGCCAGPATQTFFPHSLPQGRARQASWFQRLEWNGFNHSLSVSPSSLTDPSLGTYNMPGPFLNPSEMWQPSGRCLSVMGPTSMGRPGWKAVAEGWIPGPIWPLLLTSVLVYAGCSQGSAFDLGLMFPAQVGQAPGSRGPSFTRATHTGTHFLIP